MLITQLSTQVKNPHRINVSIDGKYRFSLDIAQVSDLGIKKGQEITEQQLAEFEGESEFGKLYARTLEYCFVRPRSTREVRDYLYKKTLQRKYKTRQGEVKTRDGMSELLTQRVFDRLVAQGHIDDEKFAAYWIENRNQRKGSSLRKLRAEMQQKGVDPIIIDNAIAQSGRQDELEIDKILDKKARKYPDETKLTAYLARQGFSYDDIKQAIAKRS